MDLTPSLQLRGNTHAPLPEVTVVFAAVENGAPFAAQHSREEVHALNKQIIKCMVQQLRLLPAGDGYLCRCGWIGRRVTTSSQCPPCSIHSVRYTPQTLAVY